MITRKYTNVSGSPEVDVRRMSPTLNNTKVYPGTQVEFTEAEWNALDESQRRLIQSYVDQGVFHEELSGAATAPEPSGEATPEATEEESTEDTPSADETSTDSATTEEEPSEPSDEGSSTDEAETSPSEEEVEEETQAPAEEETPDGPDEEETPEEPSEEEIGEFDYAAFLDGNIADVKERYNAMDEPPNLEELIAHEEAGDARKGMLTFFADQKEG